MKKKKKIRKIINVLFEPDEPYIYNIICKMCFIIWTILYKYKMRKSKSIVYTVVFVSS